MGAVRLAEPINSAKFIYMPPYGARRSITPRASLQCAKVRPRGVPWMGGAVVFAFFFLLACFRNGVIFPGELRRRVVHRPGDKKHKHFSDARHVHALERCRCGRPCQTTRTIPCPRPMPISAHSRPREQAIQSPQVGYLAP